MKYIVFGAHPDDPESGCGGLIARAIAEGHQVHCLYATTFRPGRELLGKGEHEVRSEEARLACEFLGADYSFLDYPHESIGSSLEDRNKFRSLVQSLDPDIFIAHWPVDTHPDHRASAHLAVDAFLELKSFSLFYFEVLTGIQSMRFTPTHYVDISSYADQKKEALLFHKSQNPEQIWEDHELMHRIRGQECNAERAEAYIHLDRGLSDKPLI